LYRGLGDVYMRQPTAGCPNENGADRVGRQ
jgi:hypothetical protein